MQKNLNQDINSGTILDWFKLHANENMDAFVIGNFYPDDTPEEIEAYVQFMRGSNGNRTIVNFLPFQAERKYFYKRAIYQNNWHGPWEKHTFN